MHKDIIRKEFTTASSSYERTEWMRRYCYAMMLFDPSRDRAYYRHYQGFFGADFSFPSYEEVCSRTSEPQQAIDDLTALLLDTLVPKERRWMTVNIKSRMGDGDSSDFYSEQIALSDILMTTLQKSNFYAEFTGCLKDLAIGTACMGIDLEQEEGLIKFRHIPMIEISLGEEVDSDSHIVYRRTKMSDKDVQARYGKYLKYSRPQSGTDDFDIVERVKRKNLNPDTLKPAAKSANPDNVIAGYERLIVVCGESDEVLSTTYHIVPPLLVFRWESSGGFRYGSGPALKQLAHVSKLNSVERSLEIGADLALRPPLVVDEGQLESPEALRNMKGGLIVQKNGLGSITRGESDPIKPINVSGNGTEIIRLLEGYKMDLRKAFYLDPYGSLEQSVRSATEVEARRSERLEKLAPMLNSFERDFLLPFVDNYFVLLMNNTAKKNNKSAFVLPQNVAPVFQGGGYTKTVEYESPQTAVKKRNDVENVRQMVGVIQGVLGQVGTVGAIKLDNTISFVNNSLGLPPDLIRSKTELKDLQDKLSSPQGGQTAPQQPTGQVM